VSVARVFSVLVVLLAPLWAFGCDDDDACHAGEPCLCQNANTCYLNCEGDACDLQCKGLVTCGAVCENDCALECHDVNDCGVSCGDACVIDCHNLEDCGAICGANCLYGCHDATKCGVRAGNGSTIDCHNASSCHVVCEGNCHVHCGPDVPDCLVECASGNDPSNCGGNEVACGSCG
jgi:hypothetical protein